MSRKTATAKRRLLEFAVIFICAAGLFTLREVLGGAGLRLGLSMASSPTPPTVAQLFYDTGRGYSEAESQTVSKRSQSLSEFQRFEFALPDKTIVGLRFDPSTTHGTYIIRDVVIRDADGTGLEISPKSLLPLNQIASETWDAAKKEVTLTSLPEADDPGINIALHRKLRPSRFKVFSRVRSIIAGDCLLAVLLFVLYTVDQFIERRRLAGRNEEVAGWSLITRASSGASHLTSVVWAQTFNALDPQKRRSIRIGLIALLIWIGFSAYELGRTPSVELSLEMSSSTSSRAQLFYDLGHGFREKDSQVLSVAANDTFDRLSFDLPPHAAVNLRFDPLVAEGKVVVRNVRVQLSTSETIPISTANVRSLNQIAARQQNGNAVAFSTIKGANDPSLGIIRPTNLKIDALIWRSKLNRIGLSALAITVLAIFTFLAFDWLLKLINWLTQLARRIQFGVDRVAAGLSDPNFLVFDAAAIWFYVVCVAVFGGFAISDLNGSSVSIYNLAYGYGGPETPLVGRPLGIRSDEWVCHTPAILNEDLSADRFDARECSLGKHFIALVANVPVRHISTFFRPQFWGFFVLPVDYAFAFYWQFKGFVLIAGIFTAALLLTGSTLWAITAALWYFFSAYTQWTYTWPSALPEMVGLACTMLVSGCYLTVARRPAGLILASLIASISIIDFVLCGYPPHMIPLIWVIVPLFVAWLLAHREVVFGADLRLARFAAVFVVVIVCLSVGIIVYRDLRVGITAVSRTDYPGSRIFSGGSLPFQTLTSHFLQWSETEAHFPLAMNNICESAGFLWLAPVTLFAFFRAEFSRFQKFAFTSLWVSFLIILLWLVFPFDAKTGAWFGLTGTGGTRALAGLGLTNILIVVLSMSRTLRPPALKSKRWGWETLVPLCGVFIVVASILVLTNRALANFFSVSDVAVAALVTTALIECIIKTWKAFFLVALLLPQAALYAGVNPIERGLGVITQSDLYKYVHTHRELLHGRWIVFDEGIVGSGFLRSIGCDVATGFDYIPDIDDFALFRANGLNPENFNRDGIVLARPLPAGAKSFVEVPVAYAARLNISPSDPMLKQLRIKYAAFQHKPADNIASQLVALSDGPVGGMWLYRER